MEMYELLGAILALAVGFGLVAIIILLGIFWIMVRYPEKRHPEDEVCDTCGQVDSRLEDGQCAWCKRFYGAHK